MIDKEKVTISAIALRGDGRDMVVEVEFWNEPGKWVEVIREHSGHPEVVPIGHIVEALGIIKARSRKEARHD